MICHVGDIKISHVDIKVVDSILVLLEVEYGRTVTLIFTQGKMHGYLGMELDLSKSGNLNFTMLKYISIILSEATIDMVGEAAIPEDNQLFEVQDDPEDLTPEEQNICGTFVAKILFLCCRSRTYI